MCVTLVTLLVLYGNGGSLVFLGLSSLHSVLSRLWVSFMWGEMSEGPGVSVRRGGEEFFKEGRDQIIEDWGIWFLDSGSGWRKMR